MSNVLITLASIILYAMSALGWFAFGATIKEWSLLRDLNSARADEKEQYAKFVFALASILFVLATVLQVAA